MICCITSFFLGGSCLCGLRRDSRFEAYKVWIYFSPSSSSHFFNPILKKKKEKREIMGICRRPAWLTMNQLYVSHHFSWCSILVFSFYFSSFIILLMSGTSFFWIAWDNISTFAGTITPKSEWDVTCWLVKSFRSSLVKFRFDAYHLASDGELAIVFKRIAVVQILAARWRSHLCPIDGDGD